MTTSADTLRYQLPEIMDLAAAPALRTYLLENRGAPLELDASAVQRVGGLCLQVLLSARSTWAADGQVLSFVEPSSTLKDAFLTIGAEEIAAEIPEDPSL